MENRFFEKWSVNRSDPGLRSGLMRPNRFYVAEYKSLKFVLFKIHTNSIEAVQDLISSCSSTYTFPPDVLCQRVCDKTIFTSHPVKLWHESIALPE